jgi:hypothetical protein
MRYIATIQTYVRVSADYDVAKCTRTKILEEYNTLKEVMDWVEKESQSTMGVSDVIITHE